MIMFYVRTEARVHVSCDPLRSAQESGEDRKGLKWQLLGSFATDGGTVIFDMLAPMAEGATVRESTDLSTIPRGRRYLSEDLAKGVYRASNWGALFKRGVVAVDTGQVNAVAAVYYGADLRPRGQARVRGSFLRHKGGKDRLDAVMATKPSVLQQGEALLTKPSLWEDDGDFVRYCDALAAVVVPAVQFYSSRAMLRARFGARVAMREASDKVADSLLGTRRGPGRKLPVVVVGAGSDHTAPGTRGGGSLSRHVVDALARRTLVVFVGEQFTSKRCPGCLDFLGDCATAARSWRVHVCLGHCGLVVDRDLASAVLIGRIFVSYCRPDPHRPAYLDFPSGTSDRKRNVSGAVDPAPAPTGDIS